LNAVGLPAKQSLDSLVFHSISLDETQWD